MVTGEAGLGKRQILDELGAWLDRLPETVIYGAVKLDRVTAHVPLHAITELVLHRSGISRHDPPELRVAKVHDAVLRAGLKDPDEIASVAERLLMLPGLRAAETRPPSGPAEALAIFDAVARWLRVQAETSPIVLALRGADHLDRLTRDLLFYVAERLQDVPLLCLLFAREDRLQLRADQTLRLRPLEREHIRHQLALLLRGTISDDVLAAVEEKSQGIAFQVAELVRLLLADGRLRHDGRQWRIERRESLTGRSLIDLLVVQLARLSSAAQALLARAAVAGTTFWSRELEAATGRPVDAELAELLQSEIVVERPASRFASSRELGFRHDSLQRRLYRDLPTDARTRAHREVASWMHAELTARAAPGDPRPLADLAVVAWHLTQAGDDARAASIRDELIREARAWERPDAPDWMAWPERLDSGLLDG